MPMLFLLRVEAQKWRKIDATLRVVVSIVRVPGLVVLQKQRQRTQVKLVGFVSKIIQKSKKG